jgi:CheY-like chemotaxis protein
MPVSLLIVDDMEINRMIIKKFISAEFPDFQIDMVKNGIEAIEFAQQKQPDIMVLDWEMPYLNGLEATKILKKDPKTQLIPIIITTSYHSPERLKEALDAGADDFVSSLSSPYELNARINSVLRMNQLYTSSLQSNQEVSLQKQIIEDKNLENNRIKRIVYNIFLIYSIVATVTSFLSFHHFKLLSQNEKSISKIVSLLHEVEHFVVMGQQHLTRRLTMPNGTFIQEKKYYQQFDGIETGMDTLLASSIHSPYEIDMLKKLRLLTLNINSQINQEIATFKPNKFNDLRILNNEIGALYIVIKDLRNYYSKKRHTTLETVKIINLIMVTITVIVTIFLAASVQFFIKEDSKQRWWFKLFFR